MSSAVSALQGGCAVLRGVGVWAAEVAVTDAGVLTVRVKAKRSSDICFCLGAILQEMLGHS